MRSWAFLKQSEIQGWLVTLAFEISRTPGERWAVALSNNSEVKQSVVKDNYEEADELYEAWVIGTTYRMGMMHRLAAEPPGVWEGSAAEIATRYFPIGSWGWVDTLKLLQENERKLNRREN